MKRLFLGLSPVLAYFALTGCGDDPVIEDTASRTGETDWKSSPNSVEAKDPPVEPVKVRPPLPTLEPPYDEYLKNAVDFKELHLSKREPGVALDSFMLVFSSGGEGADRYYRGEEQTPFSGWIMDWNDNDTLGELTRFVNGLEDGVCLTWHDNGQLESRAYHAEGEYTGEWTFWDREGNETKRETFENGVRVTP
ncbi:MAG: hypothetical protein VB980_02850 [Opitutales bacterium]